MPTFPNIFPAFHNAPVYMHATPKNINKLCGQQLLIAGDIEP